MWITLWSGGLRRALFYDWGSQPLWPQLVLGCHWQHRLRHHQVSRWGKCASLLSYSPFTLLHDIPIVAFGTAWKLHILKIKNNIIMSRCKVNKHYSCTHLLFFWEGRREVEAQKNVHKRILWYDSNWRFDIFKQNSLSSLSLSQHLKVVRGVHTV